MSNGRVLPSPDAPEGWIDFVEATPVEELEGLGTKSVNDLKRGRVFTALDLVEASEASISGIRGVGGAGARKILSVRDRVIEEAVEKAQRSVPSVPVEFMGVDFQTGTVLKGNGLSTSTQVAAFAAKNDLTDLRGVGESRADHIRSALVELRKRGPVEVGPGPVGWREQVAGELRAGASAVGVARRYGISQSLVVAIMDEFGLSRVRGAPYSSAKREELDEHKAAVFAALSAGASQAALTDVYRVSVPVFRGWLHAQEEPVPDVPVRVWMRGRALKEFLAGFESGSPVWPGDRKARLEAHCREVAAEVGGRLRLIADLERRLVEADKIARASFRTSPEMGRIRARRAYAVRVLRDDAEWDIGRIKDWIGAPQDPSMLKQALGSDRDLPLGGRPEGLEIPRETSVDWFADLAARSHREWAESNARGAVAREVRAECVESMLGSGRWCVTDLASLTGSPPATIARLRGVREGGGARGGR